MQHGFGLVDLGEADIAVELLSAVSDPLVQSGFAEYLRKSL